MDTERHTFDPAKAHKLEDESRVGIAPPELLLEAMDADGSSDVADLGCGTGFFARRLAPEVRRLYGVDLQRAMLDEFVGNGVGDNVRLVHAAVERLPFRDSSLDAAFCVATLHEFVSRDALEGIRRVTDGVFVAVDFKKERDVEGGPPFESRVSLEEAVDVFGEVFDCVESGDASERTYYVAGRTRDVEE